jgi:hypothetical protein
MNPALIAIIETSFVLTVWIVTFIVLAGVGWLFRRNVGVIDAFWLGISFCILLLQVWHFLAPINLSFLILVVPLSLLGWHCRKGQWIDWRSLSLILPIAFVVANIALNYPAKAAYDTELYHIQNVMWNASYPTLPGLANVHDRFGFNSSYLLYATLFESLPGGAPHYAAGTLIFPVIMAVVCALIKVVSGAGTLNDKLQVILVVPVVLYLSSVGSLNTDFGVLLVGVTLILRYFSIVNAKSASHEDVVFICLLSAVNITFKLSFAVFGIIVIIVTLYYYQRNFSWKWLLVAGALSTGLVGTWVARNYIISGYPLFPETVAGIQGDWAVPIRTAQSTRDWVYSWARRAYVTPREVLASNNWISDWWTLRMQAITLAGPISISLISFIPLIIRRIRPLFQNWLYFLPHIVALCVWFITAPEPRFATLHLWGFSLGLFIAAVGSIRISSKLIVLTTLLLCYFVLGYSESTINVTGFQGVQSHATKPFTTDTGLTVYVPEGDDRCSRAPLPCTPYFDPGLELRTPNDFSSGFRTTSEGRGT